MYTHNISKINHTWTSRLNHATFFDQTLKLAMTSAAVLKHKHAQ